MSQALLDQVTAFLAGRQVEAYLVGGYVRDLLLKKPSNDIDIAVKGDAIALARDLAKALDGHFVLLDIRNAIARVVAQNHRAYVDFTQLRDGDLRADLAARDFTFNALAIPLTATGLGQVLDLFGGQRDLKLGLVRAVSDSAFRDDPVRLVRAVRFAAQLGYRIEEHTVSLIKRDALWLSLAAPERVRDEFVKILTVAGAWHNLHLLDDLGLLSIMLPEIDALRGVEQPPEHYYDVFFHTLAVTDAVEETLSACGVADVSKRPAGPPHPPLPVAVLGAVAERVRPHMAEVVAADRTRVLTLKLAALFHDIAKPQVRAIDAEGQVRFYDHPVQGATIAEEALSRLRFSVREIQIVSTIVRNHMRPAQIAADPQATMRAIYRYFRDTGPEGVDTLLLSLADHIGTQGPRLDPLAWWRHAQFTRFMLEYYYARPEPAARPPRLLRGHDIMKHLNIPPGPLVGELLEEVREAQMLGEVTTREEALAFIRQMYQQKQTEALS